MEQVTLDSTEVQPTITYVPHPYLPLDKLPLNFYHGLLVSVSDGMINIDGTRYGLCTGQEMPIRTLYVEFDNLICLEYDVVPDVIPEEDLAILPRNFHVYMSDRWCVDFIFKFHSDMTVSNPQETSDSVIGDFGGSFTYKNKWRIKIYCTWDSSGVQHIRIDPDTDTLIIWQHSVDYSVKYEYHLKDHVYIPLLAESSLPEELCLLILQYI